MNSIMSCSGFSFEQLQCAGAAVQQCLAAAPTGKSELALS